ncbi:MAG: hypothetical protein ACTHPS_13575 [Streptosporangiaceae bacterium]
MNQRRDLAWAVGERERTRRRFRRVAVTVGTASLATAGVVAYYLPGPAHVTVTNEAATTTPAATQPPAAAGHWGDDGGDEGITAPSDTANQAPALASSGGS